MGSFFVRYFLEKGRRGEGGRLRQGQGKDAAGGEDRFASFPTNAEAVKGCDVTVIAVPMDSTLKVAKEVAGKLKPGSTLVEISSVKGETLPALRKLVGERRHAALDPPALRPRPGIDEGDEDRSDRQEERKVAKARRPSSRRGSSPARG